MDFKDAMKSSAIKQDADRMLEKEKTMVFTITPFSKLNRRSLTSFTDEAFLFNE